MFVGLGKHFALAIAIGPVPDHVGVSLVCEFLFDDDDDGVLAMTAATGILVTVAWSVRRACDLSVLVTGTGVCDAGTDVAKGDH
jgi:hypothetical protein